MIDLLKLQNGSDVRGVAAEGIAEEPVTLTPDAVNLIGQAFVGWLSKRSGKPAEEGKKIGAFIEKLAKGIDEREYRMKIQTEDFAAYGKEVLAAFESRAKEAGYAIAPNSYEGIRISFRSEEVQGRLLLRLSLHDPLMPLNMEGVREGDCEKMIGIVRELLTGFDLLDVI